MTNAELNKLSVSELLDLNKRLISIVKDKQQIESLIKKSSFSVKDRVEYIGKTSKIRKETFIIRKINKVNIVCESELNGSMWNIKACNLKLV